ncbi:hypothetical protein [Chromobacterium haemolyticum]|uniref:hypothetical protein n=1 Tax=Chromobacterium haemolyticum TaxID=394935 RepID=UPI001374A1CB|nr:hypothetical protein [Chromobacterium haemolyticum]
MDVMCLMHDSEEYGTLRWSLKEIAQAVGCKAAELKALVNKGVLKGSDTELTEALTYIPVSGRRKGPTVTLIDITKGPLWYSSRMVIDEYKRCARSGIEGSPNRSPNPPFGEDNGDDIGAAPNPSPSRAGPRAGGRPSTSTSTSTTQEPKGSFVSDARAPESSHSGIPVPDDFLAARVDVAKAQSQGLDLATEVARFVAHYQARRETRADLQAWEAQFRKWMLDQQQFNADRQRVTDAKVLAVQNSTTSANAKQAALGAVLNPPPRGQFSGEREIKGEVIPDEF